ncbi:fimbrillin family protein [Parasphaerochaeta coccoides]|uniref:Listeria/Bacterioides repeat-containing protein n=1 Tax=Parasphaerochaeta coccoides (strain ATCC BAA-1237 / DSM 17374 / SPN1) TaxID=760011 RepID=F4GLP3_PARC1|nr:Listeria/Bacterioides repeat-containing protein [Parasphaerochaeta coccoides DSM 17374]
MSKSSRPGFVVLTTILILLAALISCDSKLNVSNTNEVRFTSEIGRKATADSEWQADDEVGIYMVAHDALTATAASERANKLYTADTAFQTSGFTPATVGDTLKWDDISTPAITHFDFIAYYPYVSSIANTTALPINVYPGSGEQDTGKADFLWGRTDNVQNNTSTVHLKLDHMLSRLIVNISPSTTVDATAINDATGGFTATVKGLNTQSAINLNDGTLGTTDTSASILMKDISDTLTATERTEGKRRFEAVLIPVDNTFALANVSLEFTLSGGAGAGTYTWAADSVATSDQGKIHFDKGKQHVYNMTLNTSDEEVAVAAIEIEIGDWDESDGGNWGAVKAYRLTFDDNDATNGNAPGQILAHEGSQITLPGPGDLEKNIHYFYGWNTDPAGTGTQYAAGDTLEILDQDVTLYARWLVKIKSVFTGYSHTMILKEDGTLWATGSNYYGQLGLGYSGILTNRSTPEQVTSTSEGSLPVIASISAGGYHTMIVDEDGSLWATGSNEDGQLGLGDSGSATDRSTLEKVPSMGTDVADVFVGGYHTMILKKNNTLWAIGWNSYGQLGDGTSGGDPDFKSTPVEVWDSPDGQVKMTDVAAVSIGDEHTMILKKDGTLWGTGFNYWGQLGDVTTINRSIPVQATSMGTDVEAVSAGYSFTMILKKNNTLWGVGENADGQLGDNTRAPRKTPVQVMEAEGVGFMTDVKAVSAGYYYTMIVKKDGTLWATGDNWAGQLGDGTTTDRTTPVQVKGAGGVGFMTDVKAVSGGDGHTMILKNDGTLWATGFNHYGQLGDGTTTDRTTPVQIIL